MASVSGFLFLFGGSLVALTGVVFGAFGIVHFHRKRANRRGLPLAVHMLAMVATAALAGFLAMRWGFDHYCVAGAGAQCGLGGVFITGPIGFGIGALAYSAAYAVWDIKLR